MRSDNRRKTNNIGFIILVKVSNRNRLRKAINRLINDVKLYTALDENISEIEDKEHENKEKIEEKIRKAIKEFKTKKKEELDNWLFFLKAACKCFGGYEKKRNKIKKKTHNIFKEFKEKLEEN